MIKFRCASCGKKLGVPLEHAGKWAKCPTCAQPTRVPQPPSPDQDGLVPFKEPEATSPPPAPPRAAIPGEQTCPKCGGSNVSDTEFCVSCGLRLMVGSPPGERSEPSHPSLMVLLGLLAALAFSAGAGVLWAVLVYYAGFRWFSFLAVMVCALAGVGFTLVSKKRGVGIGLLVGCLGLCGILVGKVLIASWVVMPQLAEIRGLESVEITELSEEQIKEVMQDDQRMFCVACRDVARQEQWDDDLRFNVMGVYSWGMKDLKVSEEEKETINTSIAHVKEVLGGWTDSQKSAAIQADWMISQTEIKEFAKGMARFAREAMEESKARQAREMAQGTDRSSPESEKEEQRASESEMQPGKEEIPPKAVEVLEFVEGTRSLAETFVAWPLALLGSFSLLDLVWFPLGFWGAFKTARRA